MSGPSSLLFPSSRVLASWRPHLDRLHPRAAWIHHLRLHRVEACVAVTQPALEPLRRLLLEAAASAQSRDELARVLHLDPPFVHRLLEDLVETGLLAANATGGWTLTDSGQLAVAGRRQASVALERRTFWFADGDPPHSGKRFLPLSNPPSSSLAGLELQFDVAILQQCLDAPHEWKERHHFPTQICSFTPTRPGWREAVVHRAEELTLLGVLTDDPGELFLGFAVRPGDWEVAWTQPVLKLQAAWRESLPELATPTTLEQWRAVWGTWSESRHLLRDEIGACKLELAGLALVVHPPPALLERLQSMGEIWLLAGSGRTRELTCVEIAGF